MSASFIASISAIWSSGSPYPSRSDNALSDMTRFLLASRTAVIQPILAPGPFTFQPVYKFGQPASGPSHGRKPAYGRGGPPGVSCRTHLGSTHWEDVEFRAFSWSICCVWGWGSGVWTPAAAKIAWTMHTAEDLRVPARSGKDARRNARLSMAAPVPEGVGRTEAGRMTGAGRRAVRDRVHRCNAESPEGFRARCRVGCAGLGRGGVGPGTRRGCSLACSQFRSAFSVRVKARVREVLGSSALSQPVEV